MTPLDYKRFFKRLFFFILKYTSLKEPAILLKENPLKPIFSNFFNKPQPLPLRHECRYYENNLVLMFYIVDQ